MQVFSRMARRMARPGLGALTMARPGLRALPVRPHARNSSFIKSVMEQVKRDMEADPQRKKDWEKAQASSQRLSETASRGGEKLEQFTENLKSVSSKTSKLLSDWKEKALNHKEHLTGRLNSATEESEQLKKARESMRQSTGSLASGSKVVLERTKEIFSGVMDKTSEAFDYFGDSHTRNAKLKTWKEQQAYRAAYAEQQAAEKAAAEAADKSEPGAEEATAKMVDATSSEEATAASRKTATPEPTDALVVGQDNTSSWDRFGTRLRDMPFLSNMFENPFFDRVFGESEIAAAIREMKEMDYNFALEEFAEDVEYVVAPHIIKTYLEGDAEALEAHCGEAAFAAVNASIKARRVQQLTLDTKILAGPNEVNLAGAKLMDKGPPCFIWTFQMQQVNCLRDKTGEIIEGAPDDIRTVCYAMVVQRHPQIEEKPNLEYPWQISELAILWNQPCF